MKFNRKTETKSQKLLFMRIITHMIFACSLVLIIFALSCAGMSGRIEFSNTTSIKGDSVTSKPSNVKIDNENTYEVFFKLEKDIECIRFTASATILIDKFKNRKSVVKIYFVIDQTIDLSKFQGVEKKYVFTEIGKNFDNQFNHTKFLTICPGKMNPLFKLKQSKLYRIRYTIFKPENFEYKLSIFSNCKVMDAHPLLFFYIPPNIIIAKK